MSAPPLSPKDKDDLTAALQTILAKVALKPLTPSQKRIRELVTRLRHKPVISDDDVKAARNELSKIMTGK